MMVRHLELVAAWAWDMFKGSRKGLTEESSTGLKISALLWGGRYVWINFTVKGVGVEV